MTTSIPLPICSTAVFPRFFSAKKGFGKNWRKEQQIIQFFEPGKTRMVTRFWVDVTDSSPQDFESFSLRPLRYVSIFLLTFSMPLCNPFMPLCNPFAPAHAANSYTQLTQAFNYDSLSHFNYFCNPFMHLYLSFFRLSHHPRISRA